MAESSVIAAPTAARSFGSWLSVFARQRELSLTAIMVVLGALVSIIAPQFLTFSNLTAVAVLASIYAIASVGEALVVITRNIDLSVEATIGVVAYCVASILERHVLDAPAAIALGIGIGLILGMANGVIVAVLRVPSIVATLGTLSIFRGLDYVIAGSHQVPLAGLPPGFTDPARTNLLGFLPVFVLVALVVVVLGTVILRWTRFGRQVYAVGSNPEAAAILGIPARLVEFVAFSVCGLLAGVAGVMWVMFFGTINGTAGTGIVLSIVAAVVVGGVSTLGGSGTIAGAALGALFLGFTANALPLVGLSQFWLQAIYGLVILIAVSADAIILRRIKRATAGHRDR
jgi:rhamnose transport system permease protein